MKNILGKLSKLNSSSWSIISGVFVTRIAKNIVIPFFSIYLVQNIHFSMLIAGIMISARIWGQRGFALIAGPIVDFLDIKLTMIIGLLLMSISYFCVAYSISSFQILILTLVLGLGSAFYDTAVKKTITYQSDYEEKVFILSLRTTAMYSGSALGPLFGGLIFILSPKMIFISTSMILLILSGLSVFFIKISAIVNSKKTDVFSNLRLMFKYTLKNRNILKLILMTILFYIFLIQIEVTYPLFASENFNNMTVSFLFIINALIIIIFQIPMSRWIAKTAIKKIFLISMMITGVGLVITSVSFKSLTSFLLSIVVFSFGEILIMPKLDSDISSFVPANITGTAFGVLGLASAIGAAIGGTLGGHFYGQLAKAHLLPYYWGILGSIAILLGILTTISSKEVIADTELNLL